MIKLKFSFLLFCLSIIFLSCNSQSGDKINLSKIIFHLSRCNGTCPQINLEIDSSKNLYVDREYFKTKSITDSLYSGQFKGTLAQAEYNKLLKLLEECKIETLKFPETDVKDLVEVTIIVYYNGKRKYLKSAETPAIANNLISFLKSLGENKNLKRTNEIKAIEW